MMIQQYNEESEMNIDLKAVENLSEKKSPLSLRKKPSWVLSLAILKERKKSKLVERPTRSQ